MLRKEQDREDAVQEAMLRLVKGKDRFDPKRGTLLALGRTTVRRIALDVLSRRAPEIPERPIEAVAPAAPAPLEAEQVRGRLMSAVDALPDPQRVAFLLVHQEGLSHDAASEELKISKEGLRARLYRARCQLRIALKDVVKP